jgi:hypothetical protein
MQHTKRGPSARIALRRDAARDDNVKQGKDEERFLVAAQANCVRLLRSLGVTA